MSLIRDYLSMESHGDDDAPNVNVEVEVEVEVPEVEPVSEEEEYEVDEQLEEEQVERLAQEAFVELQESIQEEIDAKVASLEAHIDILTHGLENGQFSPQYAASVQHSLEEYSVMLGETNPAVSLENFGHDNLQEYYEASLEDLTEKLYKIGTLPDRIVASLLSSVASAAATQKRSSVATGLRKKADAKLEELAKNPNAAAVEVNLSGMGKKIGVKGQIPSDVMGAFKKDQQATAYLLDKYLTSAFDYNSAILEGTRNAVKKIRAKEGDGATEIAAKIAGQTTPEKSLPAGIIDGSSLIGNVRVEIPEMKDAADAAGKLKALSKRKVKFKKVSGDGGATSAKLSPQDVKGLLNMAKAYAVMIEKANGTAQARAKGMKTEPFFDKAYVKNEGDAFRKFFGKNKAVQALGELSRKYPNTVARMVSGSFSHAVDSARTAIALSERAMKQMGKSNTEKKDDE